MSPFTAPIRVRYYEADQMGIVHHSEYIRYLELARIEWMRALGLSYREMEEAGLLLVVADLNIKYRAPARFDDELVVEVSLQFMTAIRVVLDYVIRRPSDGAVVAEATTTLASVDRQGSLVVLPPSVRALLPPGTGKAGRRRGPPGPVSDNG